MQARKTTKFATRLRTEQHGGAFGKMVVSYIIFLRCVCGQIVLEMGNLENPSLRSTADRLMTVLEGDSEKFCILQTMFNFK